MLNGVFKGHVFVRDIVAYDGRHGSPTFYKDNGNPTIPFSDDMNSAIVDAMAGCYIAFSDVQKNECAGM